MTAIAATLDATYSMPASRAGCGDLGSSTTNAQARALDQFLASIERKAFKIAQLALRHDDDALDAVQDAMLSLVRSYAARPADEWKPLFYRILDNRILDMQRRRTVRGRVMSLLPFGARDRDGAVEGEEDPIEQAPSPVAAPLEQLEMEEAIGALESAIAALPDRQRQCFLLRNFEGLDVAQTATAMGCSEGSVKTHYFRALQALREALGELEP
jgi:RNA polymerase sigma-70 factor (ECF subfamily)